MQLKSLLNRPNESFIYSAAMATWDNDVMCKMET